MDYSNSWVSNKIDDVCIFVRDGTHGSFKDAENPERSELIKAEIKKSILECPFTIDKVNTIYINFKESYVAYTFFIKTHTIEENFKACSWVRENLMQRLAVMDIHIPHNTLDINMNDKSNVL